MFIVEVTFTQYFETHLCIQKQKLVCVSAVCRIFCDWQYKTCKDGSVLGVTVMRIALLTHCQALTQSCGYTEGEYTTHIHIHARLIVQSKCFAQKT